jgi:esterase
MKLYFRKFGNGKPLIILHGLYGSSDNWFTFGKTLSKFYEVYLIDLRNHGRSPHSDEHNYKLMIQDLAEFFEMHQLEKAVVMGHSMGGKTAMLFALRYPSKVSKLVVVDASPKSYENDLYIADQIRLHKTIVTALSNFDISAVHSREDADEALAKEIPNIRIRLFLLKNLKRDPKGHYYWTLNIKVISRNLENILNDFDPDLWKDVETPHDFSALFIKGQLSDYLLESDKSKILELFPNAVLETIPNAGHWVHAEQPKLFLSVLLKFLQQNS